MTWIKICGTTNLEDALLAVDAGADALGFVFHEKSPRAIDSSLARQIVNQLPPSMENVGVFVNETVEGIRDVAQKVGLSAVQLHGDEDLDFIHELERNLSQTGVRVRYIKALSMNSSCATEAGTIAGTMHSNVESFLLDSSTPDRRGGTGHIFEWSQAKVFVERYKTIVAGGLTPENVGEAIGILHPWGVDVASGVEAMPGKKDPQKVFAFISAVRATEQNV